MVTKESLIASLPPYQGREVLIVERQDVPDIMTEVCEAHKHFAADYDKIAKRFWKGNIYDTCEALYWFCRDNIWYDIEHEDCQTTKSPAAILSEGYGDCKHYAGFIAGVLDAINRIYGADIRWCYRFASYNEKKRLPGHVFVVAWDDEGEIWIDPVLDEFDERKMPTYHTDKKPSMSLSRVSGIASDLYGPYVYGDPGQGFSNAIGWTYATSTGYVPQVAPIHPKVGDPFFGADYLGLSHYGPLKQVGPLGVHIGPELTRLTNELQAIIDEQGPVKYKLTKDIVQLVLQSNIQNWNFFYPNGTSPVPRPWQSVPEFKEYLSLIITDDGRLTFDRDEEPPHNWPAIHKMVDWVNYLVQKYSDEPYIPRIEHLKKLGKGWHTPEGGSLWHVIHSGDVNAQKLKAAGGKILGLIAKIPGLGSLLQQVTGKNPGDMIDAISTWTGPLVKNDGTPTIPGAMLNEGTPPAAGKSNTLLYMGIAAVGLYALSRNKKISGAPQSKSLTWIALGGLALLLLTKKSQATPQPPLPPVPGGTTQTPDIMPVPEVMPQQLHNEQSQNFEVETLSWASDKPSLPEGIFYEQILPL